MIVIRTYKTYTYFLDSPVKIVDMYSKIPKSDNNPENVLLFAKYKIRFSV